MDVERILFAISYAPLSRYLYAFPLFPGQKQSLVRARFRVTAPTVFNSLSQYIRSTDNNFTFRVLLKTFYFRNAYINTSDVTRALDST